MLPPYVLLQEIVSGKKLSATIDSTKESWLVVALVTAPGTNTLIGFLAVFTSEAFAGLVVLEFQSSVGRRGQSSVCWRRRRPQMVKSALEWHMTQGMHMIASLDAKIFILLLPTINCTMAQKRAGRLGLSNTLLITFIPWQGLKNKPGDVRREVSRWPSSLCKGRPRANRTLFHVFGVPVFTIVTRFPDA